MVLAYFLLAFSVVGIVMAIRVHRKQKERKKALDTGNATTITIDLNTIMKDIATKEAKRQAAVGPVPIVAPSEPDAPIFDRHNGGRAFQLLESIYIVETTKNYRTFADRMDFIVGIYGKFIPASQSRLYKEQMTDVHKYYKTLYPDRELTSNQIALTMSSDIDNMQLFYAESTVRFYERYIAHQTDEMNVLKTSAAKERRKEDMSDKGYLVGKLFETYQLPDIGHLDRIKYLRQRIKEYK